MTAVALPCVGIIDYHAGNLRSIENAFEFLGARHRRVAREADLEDCSHLVLPGVGAFGFCAERLARSGLTGAIAEWAFERQRPLLGICVGMQLLADWSEESPGARGLGWVAGAVRAIPAEQVRVPHVGWNTVRFEQAYGDFSRGHEADFYFDHSYAFSTPTHNDVVAVCDHGVTFGAVLRRGALVAVQFHPEKSQAAGIRFLANFLRA